MPTDFPRIGLRVGNELRHGLGWYRGMHQHDIRHTDDAGDRRDVAYETEVEFLVERGVDGIRRKGQEERIAIRSRSHDRLGGDVAAGTRPIIDEKWLAEPFR
jgi:hypothetical protein